MHSLCFDKHSYRRLGAGDIAGACEIMKNSLLSLPVTLRFFSSVFLPSRSFVVLFTYLLVSRFYPYSVRYGLFRCALPESSDATEKSRLRSLPRMTDNLRLD